MKQTVLLLFLCCLLFASCQKQLTPTTSEIRNETQVNSENSIEQETSLQTNEYPIWDKNEYYPIGQTIGLLADSKREILIEMDNNAEQDFFSLFETQYSDGLVIEYLDTDNKGYLLSDVVTVKKKIAEILLNEVIEIFPVNAEIKSSMCIHLIDPYSEGGYIRDWLFLYRIYEVNNPTNEFLTLHTIDKYGEYIAYYPVEVYDEIKELIYKYAIEDATYGVDTTYDFEDTNNLPELLLIKTANSTLKHLTYSLSVDKKADYWVSYRTEIGDIQITIKTSDGNIIYQSYDDFYELTLEPGEYSVIVDLSGHTGLYEILRVYEYDD